MPPVNVDEGCDKVVTGKKIRFYELQMVKSKSIGATGLIVPARWPEYPDPVALSGMHRIA